MVTVDDIWIYIFQHGSVRMRDLEQAFVQTKKLSRTTLYRYRRQLSAQGKIRVHSNPGQPPYNTYWVPSEHHPALQVLLQLNHFPQSFAVHLDEIPWEDAPRDVFLTNVKQKTLHVNPDTGASIILLKSPADPRPADVLHVHPSANQWSYGLEGEAVTPDGTRWLFKDNVDFVPKGTPHGGDVITKASLALVFWAGPRTYSIIDDDYIGDAE
jgi:hypothetical protein